MSLMAICLHNAGRLNDLVAKEEWNFVGRSSRGLGTTSRKASMVSTARPLAFQSGAVSDGWETPHAGGECSSGAALDGDVRQAYNEAAFHYFLHIERTRAELSSGAVWLLVVEYRPGINGQIGAKLARKLFDAMASSVRDTDFMGWYRAERVVAAVLPQRAGTDQASGTVAHVVNERIAAALRERIPSDALGALQVRVLQLPQS